MRLALALKAGLLSDNTTSPRKYSVPSAPLSNFAAGTTDFYPTFPFEGATVGLVPLGCPVRALTTNGLKWDVSDWPSSFGGNISTSNHLVGYDAWVASSSKRWWEKHGIGRPISAEDYADDAIERASEAQPTQSAPVSAAEEQQPVAERAERYRVSVTASDPIIWTGTIDSKAVVAAWRSQQADRAHLMRR